MGGDDMINKLLKIFLPLLLAIIVALVFFFFGMTHMMFWVLCLGYNISLVIAVAYVIRYFRKK